MADYEHCFGCRHSLYVSNEGHKHIDNNDKVCLYCTHKHIYLKKNALSNLLCFAKEDAKNPANHTARNLYRS